MNISNAVHAPHSTWTGMVPVEDTVLAVTDTCAPGIPVVYLNGSYANQSHWRRVIAELGSDYRHITYDERARGKSKRSADYSFEVCIRDLDTILRARGVELPILVGWSYGAMIAMHWAARYPARVLGIVPVDAPYPHDWLDDAAREQIRKLFRRMRPLLPIARPLGLAARMTAEQHAEINIEINALMAPGSLDPVLDRVSVPVRYVVASGGHLGADRALIERIRANLDPVLARNSNFQVSARVASNHEKILRKDFGAVADAVRALSVTRDQPAG